MVHFNNRLIRAGVRAAVAKEYLGKTFPDHEPVVDLDKVFEGVSKKVCTLFMSRVGSTFLSEKLNRTGVLGTSEEMMNAYYVNKVRKENSLTSLEDYLRHCVKTTTTLNGVFSFKCQLDAIIPLIQAGELPDKSRQWSWISIHRRDLIAQAVSLTKAKASGSWHTTTNTQEEVSPSKVTLKDIHRNYEIILRKEGANELFFQKNRLKPLRLYYEDFQTEQLPTLEKIFNFLEIDPPANLAEIAKSGDLKPMRDEESDRLIKRFRRRFLD